MTDCLIVGAGGAIGAVLRYLMGKLPIGSEHCFPLRTFMVNIIGCFLIGLVAALAAKQLADEPRAVMFLKVGICSGFTTFSSFALETGGLVEMGEYPAAAAYVLLSVLLGVLAVFTAQLLAEKLL